MRIRAIDVISLYDSSKGASLLTMAMMIGSMSPSEIKRYFEMSHDELSVAADNLDLGHLRTATSRAYYAMFYATTALLGSRGNGEASIRASSLPLAKCS